MKKQVLALLGGILLIASCTSKEEEIAVSSVSISQPTAEMIIGETVQLQAKVTPSNATDKTVVWASSKQSVATVTDYGLVTAIAEGSSTITATAGGKTSSCQVTVSKGNIPVISIAIDKTSLTLEKGQSGTLTATVYPEDATDRTVTWTSSNSEVVTVDAKGTVTAVGGGNATIVAKAGSQQATCDVTVTVPVESISLDRETLTLEVESSITLVASVKPDDATDKSVTWSSSDTQIATVDEGGKVMAIKVGTATIVAKAGDKQASCVVTVQEKYIAVNSITLNKTELALEKGQYETLTATVTPDNATDKNVAWSSSNSEIVSVDTNGLVTAVSGGRATITAKAGDKQATCSVMVSVPVERVSLSFQKMELIEGESRTLYVNVTPEDATVKTVTWASSAEDIASVEQNGMVTALKAGEATINVTVDGKEASCLVTVKEKPKVSSIEFDTKSFNGYIGSDYSMSITISPSDAQYDIEWAVSDSRVASIQASGLSASVHTLDYGVSEIIAKDKISGITSSITVSTVVTDFVWKENTGQTYSGYPLITIDAGGEHQLKYSCSPSSATKLFSDLDQFVFYEPYVVSRPTCITITEDGLVLGVSEGIVGIKPTGRIIKGSSDTDRVYIKVKAAIIPVQSISLDVTSLSLTEGESATLTATITPSNATNQTVTWNTSDASVATIENGKVTAVKEGTATITAKAGDKSAECKVTVAKKVIDVTSVELNKSTLELVEGDSETLTATVKPDDATDKTVTWNTSDASVATIENGKVTAVKEGTATITAKAGDKSAECKVTVTKKVIPVESVTLNKTSLSLTKGQSETLVATVNPDNATDKTVTWSTNDASIAIVDQTGKVTANNGGTAIIAAKSGGKTATCTVTVTIPVESVTLNHTNITIKKYETLQLEAVITPSDATNTTIQWKSSAESIASVSSAGAVKGLEEGEAIITATVDGKEASCKITVVISTPGGNEGIGYDE